MNASNVLESPRLLILTLSTGEAALPHLREQIARQSYCADHVVIEGLGNQEAHEALYAQVMERAQDYELFLKVDADMTFRRDSALAEVVAGIARYPQIRHFLFPVYDHFTEQEIRGVSLYRSGVRWAPAKDRLFVDPSPIDAKASWCGGSALPFINHGEIASDFECFSFGVHKMIKVLQRDRSNKKLSKQGGRLLDLQRMRRLCRQGGQLRHWLGLLGAAWVLKQADYRLMLRKADLQRTFEAVRDDPELLTFARQLATRDRLWWRHLFRELGAVGALRAGLQRTPADKPRTVFVNLPAAGGSA
jgi:hypothetical protein